MKTSTVRQLRLRALALVTVAGTAWISFSSSQDLAIRGGFGIRSWAFPICLDAVAAFAVDVWMRRTAAQRPAAALALTAIGLSLASNVADHYLVAGTALAALLGGIPPAMLAWLLLVLHKHGQPRAATAPEPVLVAEPAPVADSPADMTAEAADWLRRNRDELIVPHLLHPEEVRTAFTDALPRWEGGAWREEPVSVPEPVKTTGLVQPEWFTDTPELPHVKPLPTNVPDNDPERTQIMPIIRDEEPGKFDPNAAGPAPAKVQPARRSAPEVTAEVDGPVYSSMTNDALIMLGIDQRLTSRRAVQAAFSVGTKRATDIARAIKEKLA
jgi:hypothetical protein